MTASEQLLNCRHIDNVLAPYVWQLRISEQEFRDMEKYVEGSINEHDGNVEHLATEQYALHTITYIAEWYKRRYKTGVVFPIKRLNLEKLWQASGIDVNRFVYRKANGHHIWQYSLYVLGGLALNQEKNRTIASRRTFLKKLCQILHNQSDGEVQIASEDHAIAFRESLRREHSLATYIRHLTGSDPALLPFTEEELANEASLEWQFMNAVRNADAEVLGEKFRYEWRFYHDDRSPYMQRFLRVNLRPEQDGKYHDYLLHQRLRDQWRISGTEQMRKMFLYLRFKDGERIVQDIDTAHPLMTFCNTGNNATGLHICDSRDYGETCRIPSVHFDRFEIVACDAEDKELCTMQPQAMPEYLQLWQTDECGSYWSDQKSRRHETAVIFSDRCQCDELLDDRKPFKNKEGKLSEQWNWKYIYTNVWITDEHKERHQLFNLIGDIQITVKTYPEVLLYDEPSMVKYLIMAMMDGQVTEQNLTLLFRKEDIIVKKRVGDDDDQATMEDMMPESIWIKPLNNRSAEYHEWIEPEYGARKVKLIVRGEEYYLFVYILPSLLDKGEILPIERKYSDCSIRYVDYEGNEHIQEDDIKEDYKPLEPTLKIMVGEFSEEKEEYVTLNVIRPTLRKEIYLDNKVKRYNDEHEFRLPYILKDRTIICDFSEKGYQRFDCSQIDGLYEVIGTERDASTSFWKEGRLKEATELNPSAPAWLKVWLGNSESASLRDEKMLMWDYDKGSEPQACISSAISQMKPDTRLFYSMQAVNNDFSCYFGRQGKPGMMNKKLKDSHVKCFELAVKHGVYFFTFKPLRDMVYRGNQKEMLYDTLVAAHNGLSSTDKQGLLRLSEELLFDWEGCLNNKEYNDLINI